MLLSKVVLQMEGLMVLLLLVLLLVLKVMLVVVRDERMLSEAVLVNVMLLLLLLHSAQEVKHIRSESSVASCCRHHWDHGAVLFTAFLFGEA